MKKQLSSKTILSRLMLVLVVSLFVVISAIHGLLAKKELNKVILWTIIVVFCWFFITALIGIYTECNKKNISIQQKE